MAKVNNKGNVTARCPGCDGANSSFEWKSATAQHGAVTLPQRHKAWGNVLIDYRLFRCGGCGRGALGTVIYGGGQYPGSTQELRAFHPEAKDRLALPKETPAGISSEFREGESCLENGCLRAAAGMFRSVLDKTLRLNGYKEKRGTTLEQQIDMAAADGIITASRQRRAHEEIRVLGNDVLHDDWRQVPEEDVEAARHYAQRVLEDFYDDRPSVLKTLRAAKRVPTEDKAQDEEP
jgi:uncharacterized protein DUF4145